MQAEITGKAAAIASLIWQVVSAGATIVRSALAAGVVAVAAWVGDLGAAGVVVAFEDVDFLAGGGEEGAGFVEEV